MNENKIIIKKIKDIKVLLQNNNNNKKHTNKLTGKQTQKESNYERKSIYVL